VKVSFEQFKFAVWMFPLAIDNVKAEVTNALRSALSFEFSSPEFCFMRFSPKDINNFQKELGEMVAQHPTRHSVLLKSNEFFWKCVPRQSDQHNIFSLNQRKLGNLKHITFHCDVKLLGGGVIFFKFPAHLPPLHKREVEKCLLDFMTRTAKARTSPQTYMESRRCGDSLTECDVFCSMDIKLGSISPQLTRTFRYILILSILLVEL